MNSSRKTLTPVQNDDVSHGPDLPAHSTFRIAASPLHFTGEVKSLPSQKTGLEREEQKPQFRGKEKDDEENLNTGVNDNSSFMFLEDPKSKERNVGELNEMNKMLSDAGEVGVKSNEMSIDAREIGVESNEMLKAFEAIARVKAEVDSLPSQKTGLEREEQKLQFRGKEKEDEENLNTGVKDNFSFMFLEDPKSKESDVGELNERNEMLGDAREVGFESNEMSTDVEEIGVESNEMSKAFEAIAGVKAGVDHLSVTVFDLKEAVYRGTKVSDKEFDVSTELLIKQLLKLDSIEAEGEARVQRKDEVRRVQDLMDTLDTLKAMNSNPSNNNSNDVTSQNNNGVTSQNRNGVASQNGNAVSVTTKSETFDSGMGSLSAPTPMPSYT